jgi:hypothetical protein
MRRHRVTYTKPDGTQTFIKPKETLRQLIARQLRIGTRIEKEHFPRSPAKARRTAWEHIVKEGYIDYYDHLLPMEKRLDAKLKNHPDLQPILASMRRNKTMMKKPRVKK